MHPYLSRVTGAFESESIAELDRSLIACIIGSLVLRCAAGAMGLLVGIYLKHINDTLYPVSATVLGLFTFGFFLTELFGSPILGAWSDHWGRKRFIVIGPILGFLAVQITALTAVLPLLFLTRLLEGLSTASSVPATLSYLSAATTASPSMRSRVISLFEIATIAGMALGGVVGGKLWDRLGAHAFTGAGVVYLVSAAIFFWGMKRLGPGGGEKSGLSHYLSLFSNPKILHFAPAWLAINAILGLWINHLPFQMSGVDTDLSQNLSGGFSGSAIGPILGGFALLFAIGILAWGLVLGRMRRIDAMLLSLGGLLLTCLAAFGLNHATLDGYTITGLLIGLLILGILIESGFTPAALSYLADISEDFTTDRGAIMGLYSVLLGFGQAIGVLAGGPFADRWHVDGIILLTAILGGISLITVLMLRRTEQTNSSLF
mgnify:CR=1 FL=1